MSHLQNSTNGNEKSTTQQSNNAGGKDSGLFFQESQTKKKGIVDIISEIQHYAVIEQKTQNEVSSDYFTVSQKLEYFKISFLTGVYEGLFFMFVFPVLLIIVPSYLIYFYSVEFSYPTILFLKMFSYFSLGVVTLLFLSFSRYYSVGNLTRTALNFMFYGRGTALLLKAGVSYYLFSWLYTLSYKSPEVIYSASIVLNTISKVINFVLQKSGMNIEEAHFTNEQFYIFFYKSIVPILEKTGFEMFLSLLIAGISPYLLILILGFLGNKESANEKKLSKY